MEFLLLSRRHSSWQNVPVGQELGEMAVFAGYGSPIDTKIMFESNPQRLTYTKILVELVDSPPSPSRVEGGV